MNSKEVIILSGLAIVMMATTGRIVFAESSAVAPADQAAITSNPQFTSQKESDMQWAWGEVTNLDKPANAITLKYLNYETDQEQELILVVDEKTAFENIKDFNALKLNDTLSIDYMIGVDNKNIAKNISFEKPDDSSSALAPEGTIVNEPASSPTASRNDGKNSELITPPPSTGQLVVDAAQLTVQSEIPVDSSMATNEAPVSTESASAPVALESVSAVQGQAQ